MNILPYGTRVRIVKPGHELHGVIAFINEDNWLERLENPDLPLSYTVDVPTPDNQDVNHWFFLATEIRKIR